MRNTQERGSVLLVAMVALTAMLGIGALAMLSVQSGVKTAGNDRFQTIALYSAESGAWAGLDFLRDNCDTTNLFSAFVPSAAGVAQMPAGIYGNNIQPG